jgi:hypothetical protein
MIFVFDKIIGKKPYPNLAKHQALPYTIEWREFSEKWPFSEPFHFLEYLDQENIEYQLVTTAENVEKSIYPISVSFFDFSIDWFELLENSIIDALRAKTLKLWFYYSEGDNPRRIQRHLRTQCIQHNIPQEQVHFTSANSAAAGLNNFSYFVDDEMLYRLRNASLPVKFHTRRRNKKFTALVRTHKWWRATSMARLWRENLHNLGYFSYNSELDIGESELDNPIEIDSFPGLRQDTYKFLKNGPYTADEYDSDYHNLYHYSIEQHYADSYLNLVLETHLDADQSKGTFLTEKTFKPIKNAQLFVILGPAGSIKQLKKMGYKTFDMVINHSYDNIENNTLRWNAAMNEAERLIKHEHLHSLYVESEADIRHNQKLFLKSKSNRLNSVLRNITA